MLYNDQKAGVRSSDRIGLGMLWNSSEKKMHENKEAEDTQILFESPASIQHKVVNSEYTRGGWHVIYIMTKHASCCTGLQHMMLYELFTFLSYAWRHYNGIMNVKHNTNIRLLSPYGY